jgi:DNA-binding SARP family transcriptional activator
MLPVTKEEAADLSDYYLFIFIGGGVILLFFYLIIRMRNKESNDLETVFELNSEPQSPQLYKNYLQLFGELAIYDKTGNDISSQFSEKPREVFLLILTRSLGKNGNGGISSDELSAAIWPDSSPESAKSNRGVTISKIRKILKSADGIELLFENKSWRVKFKNGANCDYLEFLTLKEKLLNTEKLNNGTLELLCEITREGEYLKGVSYEWLDAYKMAVNTEIMQFLKILLQSKEIEKSTELKIKICDLITGFDSVDEDAYTTKIASLYSQGNHKSAQNTYQIFIAEYRRLYDEDYPKTYNEIVNK